MYDGHSDPKQFLMGYEATISSYGGNTAVMAKSFVMAVKNVAQTWYSSLRPGTITSWQKLKDMLITSFQGFQTKPVTAQALFQCTQDHEEYLQAYVRRFLRLMAQAPTVPNEIVIEAMIKGLRPGPSAQYFARKPPQTLKKLLQKMDEYIRADNDFRQRREEAYRFSEIARGFGGRFHPRHVRSIHSTQNDDRGSQQQRPQYSSQASQASGQQQSYPRPPAPRGRGARGFGGRFGDQPYSGRRHGIKDGIGFQQGDNVKLNAPPKRLSNFVKGKAHMPQDNDNYILYPAGYPEHKIRRIHSRKSHSSSNHAFMYKSEASSSRRSTRAKLPKKKTPIASNEPNISFKTFDVSYVLTNKSGKVVAKYVGDKHKGSKTCVWVPKVLVSNVKGPKTVWVPKNKA
jgi:hypothetical protein